jgi:N utilization substance protein B
LFQLDSSGFAPSAADALALFRASAFEPDEALDDEVLTFAGQLVSGTVSNLAGVDAALQRTAQHWRLERMAKVDRNILRLAAYELLFARDVPARAVLNEAIELAKKYGTEESGAFVNGILDRVAQDARR